MVTADGSPSASYILTFLIFYFFFPANIVTVHLLIMHSDGSRVLLMHY